MTTENKDIEADFLRKIRALDERIEEQEEDIKTKKIAIEQLHEESLRREQI